MSEVLKMSLEEREALIREVLKLPEREQSLLIGAMQMAVMLNSIKQVA